MLYQQIMRALPVFLMSSFLNNFFNIFTYKYQILFS